jgi:signal transduction histidine kinase
MAGISAAPVVSLVSGVTALIGADSVSRVTALTAVISVLLASGVWFLRVRRINKLRAFLRAITALGEQMIGSQSPAEILARLTKGLPPIVGSTGVRLYLYRRAAQTLERVPTPDEPEAQTIAVKDQLDPPNGAALCARSRALLMIADTHAGSARRLVGEQGARALIFIPMFAHDELFGILELRHTRRIHKLAQDEEDALRHLANQVAAALKLLEHQQIQEELTRSEKLAAAGVLIANVVSDLRAPIETIQRRAEALAARSLPREAADEAAMVVAEARRASNLVARLANFAWQKAEARPVDLNRMLESVLAARENEWRQAGIERRLAVSMEPISVLASEAQLEQVLVSLLRRIEGALADAPVKWISLTSRRLSRHAVIEINSPAAQEPPATPTEGLGMDICRSIIQSFNGELRLPGAGATRYEIELPVAQSRTALIAGSPVPDPDVVLNILLVEPDADEQRRLVMLLGERGHRVVPTVNAEEAVDFAQRLKFDVIFSAMRLPGLNWLGLFERVRPIVPVFVLLTEGFDPPLAMSLAFVLRKPVDSDELQRLMASILTRFTTATEEAAT